METKYQREYELLKTQRVEFNNSTEILKDLKRSVWEYFRNNVCINNSIEQNMQKATGLYIAPLKQIHGSRMVCWPLINGYEIYVDNEFLNAQKDQILLNCQLTHETIHGMVRDKNGQPFKFGHRFLTQEEREKSRNPIERVDLTAFDEACTQIVAEEINNFIVDQKTDSYYLIKTIVRIITPFIGKREMLDQFCNNSTAFEDKFNILSNNKFPEFAQIMSVIHNLEKELRNKNLSEQERQIIKEKLHIQTRFISSFIKNTFGVELIKRPEIVDEYNQMSNDDVENNFDSDYNLDGLRKKYDEMGNYIFTKDQNENKIMVDRSTNEIINDKRIIDQYRMLFLWIKATRKNRHTYGIRTNEITNDDLEYAFSEEARNIFSQIMCSMEPYVVDNVPLDVNQIANSIKKYNYSYSNDIISELFKNESNIKLVIDYFSSAYYMDEEFGSKKM